MSNRVRINPGLARRIARTPGIRDQLDAVAGRILSAAHVEATAHRESGDFARSLSITHGHVDSYVTADIDYGAALEFGHVSKRTGTYVDGAHILARALDGQAQ